jgi:hypothetical protein
VFQFVDNPCSRDGDGWRCGHGSWTRHGGEEEGEECYWLPKYCTEYSSKAGRRGEGKERDVCIMYSGKKMMGREEGRGEGRREGREGGEGRREGREGRGEMGGEG